MVPAGPQAAARAGRVRRAALSPSARPANQVPRGTSAQRVASRRRLRRSEVMIRCCCAARTASVPSCPRPVANSVTKAGGSSLGWVNSERRSRSCWSVGILGLRVSLITVPRCSLVLRRPRTVPGHAENAGQGKRATPRASSRAAMAAPVSRGRCRARLTPGEAPAARGTVRAAVRAAAQDPDRAGAPGRRSAARWSPSRCR